MELKDTVNMMLSEDYKERFKAEYYQLVNRRKGLMTMLEKWENDTLETKSVCTKDIYKAQLDAMENYIAMLEIRAYFEKIDLSKNGGKGLFYSTEFINALENAVTRTIEVMKEANSEAKKGE